MLGIDQWRLMGIGRPEANRSTTLVVVIDNGQREESCRKGFTHRLKLQQRSHQRGHRTRRQLVVTAIVGAKRSEEFLPRQKEPGFQTHAGIWPIHEDDLNVGAQGSFQFLFPLFVQIGLPKEVGIHATAVSVLCTCGLGSPCVAQQGRGHKGMVLHVLPNRQVAKAWDAMLLEVFLFSNAAQHQQLRRQDGTGGQDHLMPALHRDDLTTPELQNNTRGTHLTLRLL
mmetsp:Transcript_49131/g.106930  ORF Transcript_49131/g.106930 Transcript_49131/m.106930 type:complete len:226 (+) Transcript_49131:96-773(+)